jgi:predicted enzyme related to lactoylglutathione lyase
VITGAHAVLFSTDPAADRAFFKDVLGFPSADAGGGWLIFRLPPSEAAFHPTDGDPKHELYLMCDDLAATVTELESKGVDVTRPVSDARWGIVTAIRLPSGAELALYEPRHPVP